MKNTDYVVSGKEKEYNASDLSTRYKKKEKRTVFAENKTISFAREFWNIFSNFVLLLLASLAVYAASNSEMQNSLYNIALTFLKELGLR